MKALILAAGYGTRLRPYTDHTPKALFPILSRPLLDLSIRRLIGAGCRDIIVNTHHLAERIEEFLAQQTYSVPVATRYEPELLDTGGAIRNLADFWTDEPFMVVNSDIVTDIDLADVYRFHLDHPHPVTLVLHDDPAFNTVKLDDRGVVEGFIDADDRLTASARRLTFTGIQVLDSDILRLIPDTGPSGIKDAYRQLMADGGKIEAYCTDPPRNSHWKDIGTPNQYRQTVYDAMAPVAFGYAFPEYAGDRIESIPLSGDGSDRSWYRLRSAVGSLIMADHGIRKAAGVLEADAFVSIGNHLRKRGIHVPGILLHDTFSGLVFLEDLGDVNLQAVVRGSDDPNKIRSVYNQVIRRLVRMSIDGYAKFDPAWAYQTPRYDEELIVERECGYFVKAFLNGYLGWDVPLGPLSDEFHRLADGALSGACTGFMHRDFQSRNIMVRSGNVYFIDFQGGRTGPIQYDLASLLIDPYVALPHDLQTDLLTECIGALSRRMEIDHDAFRRAYAFCALARNLQILGAYGYLSRVKGKAQFEQYIPAALKSLKRAIDELDPGTFPKLIDIADRL